MLKFLLFAGVIAGVYFFFTKKKSLPPSDKSTTATEEAMVECTTCGTYAEIKETFIRDGHYFCSRECMEG